MAARSRILLCLLSVFIQLIPRSQPLITKQESSKDLSLLLNINGESTSLGKRYFLPIPELAFEKKSVIITISETWLNTTVTSAEVQIESYKLHRLDRLHKRGGGVCAYVRKDLKSSVLKDLTSISERNFHQLWIKVQCKKCKSIIICVTYRPDDSPLSSFEELLKPCYIQALTLDKPITILGDSLLRQTFPKL